MLPAYKAEAALRLKVATGHLEAVRRMVDEDAYCVELISSSRLFKGPSARPADLSAQSPLELVSDAIKDGMGDAIIDELMSALQVRHEPDRRPWHTRCRSARGRRGGSRGSCCTVPRAGLAG